MFSDLPALNNNPLAKKQQQFHNKYHQFGRGPGFPPHRKTVFGSTDPPHNKPHRSKKHWATKEIIISILTEDRFPPPENVFNQTPHNKKHIC